MNAENPFPKRKKLPHAIPSWVDDGAIYFITVCCKDRSTNLLCHDKAFEVLTNALQVYEDKEMLYVRLFLAMPDHVHFLAVFHPYEKMSKTIALWKAYTSRSLGFKWQRDFFDHRLRNDTSLVEKASYIRNNPVRAGLVECRDNWAFIREH